MVQASQPTLIGVTWPPDPFLGWGVYGLNLVLQTVRDPNWHPVLLMAPPDRALANPMHRRLITPLLAECQRIEKEVSEHPNQQGDCKFPVLYALGNDLGCMKPKVIGQPRIGVVFFENTQFSPKAFSRAGVYNVLVTGSKWNEEVLRRAGLQNVRTVHQGIDATVFHPAPKSNLHGDRFVVFSGGKLEYRKGQDIAIAAYRQFAARHPEALLVFAWHNEWHQFVAEIGRSGHVVGAPRPLSGSQLNFSQWLTENGVPPNSALDLGAVPNALMGQILREADVALFTNRCEGGTNLVAMECMACGIPTILSANTGHLDLIDDAHCYSLSQQTGVKPTETFTGTDGWGESDVDEVVAALERVYTSRAEAADKGQAAAQFMQDWTWERQIQRLLETVRACV